MILKPTAHQIAVIQNTNNVMMGTLMSVWDGATQTTSTLFMVLAEMILTSMGVTASGHCGPNVVQNVEWELKQGSAHAPNPYLKEQEKVVLILVQPQKQDLARSKNARSMEATHNGQSSVFAHDRVEEVFLVANVIAQTLVHLMEVLTVQGKI